MTCYPLYKRDNLCSTQVEPAWIAFIELTLALIQKLKVTQRAMETAMFSFSKG